VAPRTSKAIVAEAPAGIRRVELSGLKVHTAPARSAVAPETAAIWRVERGSVMVSRQSADGPGPGRESHGGLVAQHAAPVRRRVGGAQLPPVLVEGGWTGDRRRGAGHAVTAGVADAGDDGPAETCRWSWRRVGRAGDRRRGRGRAGLGSAVRVPGRPSARRSGSRYRRRRRARPRSARPRRPGVTPPDGRPADGRRRRPGRLPVCTAVTSPSIASSSTTVGERRGRGAGRSSSGTSVRASSGR
jgi:hypothetical protein